MHAVRLCFVWLWPYYELVPDSKVHGANMGPIWGRQDPGARHVGPMNLAIWGWIHLYAYYFGMIHQHWSYRCLNGKRWYIQHSCVGNTMMYREDSNMIGVIMKDMPDTPQKGPVMSNFDVFYDLIWTCGDATFGRIPNCHLW